MCTSICLCMPLACLLACSLSSVHVGVNADWAIGPALGHGPKAESNANAIARDGQGGTYIAGTFKGTCAFGATRITSHGIGTNDIFVSHMSSSGVIDWAVRAGGLGDDVAYSITSDGHGGALVAGFFAGNASFGATMLKTKGSFDAFVLHVKGYPREKTDYFGGATIDWAVSMGGMELSSATGIAYDGEGGAYVAGFFTARGGVFGATTLDADDGVDTGFVAHVGRAGTIDWAVKLSLWIDPERLRIEDNLDGLNASLSARARSVASDGAGGFYVVANLEQKSEAFVLRINSKRDLLWNVKMDTRQGQDIAFEAASGGVFVTGYGFASPKLQDPSARFWQKVFTSAQPSTFVSYVSADGTLSWTQHVSGIGAGTAVAYDGSRSEEGGGGVWLTGFLETSPNKTSRVLAMHFSRAGDSTGLLTAADGIRGIGKGIVFDGKGAALVVGSFEGDSTTFGGTPLPSGSGIHEAFVTRLRLPRLSLLARSSALPLIGLRALASSPWVWVSLLGALALFAFQCLRNRRLRKRLLNSRASRERAEHDMRMLTHRCGHAAEPPPSCHSLASHEPGHSANLSSPPVSLPPGPPSSSSFSSAGVQMPMQPSGASTRSLAETMPSTCEMTMWNGVMASWWPDDGSDGGGSAIGTAEDLLEQLNGEVEPLEWGMACGPAEAFGDLPILSLIAEAMDDAGHSTSSSLSTPPLANGIESAAWSVASFTCDAAITPLPAAAATTPPPPDPTSGLHPIGHARPPAMPLLLPEFPLERASAKAAAGGHIPNMPMQRSDVACLFGADGSSARTSSDESAAQAATTPPKERVLRSVDKALWDGAEAAGWKRHATKNGAWIDPQGKYHESASGAKRQAFATPDEAAALAKQAAESRAKRNARFRERKRQMLQQEQRSVSEGASTASGDRPQPLG